MLTNDTDVDTGATQTVAAVNGSAGNVGAAVAGTYGSVTINADGSYSYTLDNADADTNALAQGASVTDVFSYTVTDEHGATSTANLTITITGTNDAPVAVDDVGSGNEDTVITGTVATNDSDVDAGAVLSYAVIGASGGIYFRPRRQLEPRCQQRRLSAPRRRRKRRGGRRLHCHRRAWRERHRHADHHRTWGQQRRCRADAKNDSWVLSNTAIPAGTITPEWLLHNDTDADTPAADLFVSAVSGLPSWLTANFVAGKLVGITVTGTPVLGTHSFHLYTVGRTQTDTATVTVQVIATTTGNPATQSLWRGTIFPMSIFSGNDTISGDANLTGPVVTVTPDATSSSATTMMTRSTAKPATTGCSATKTTTFLMAELATTSRWREWWRSAERRRRKRHITRRRGW